MEFLVYLRCKPSTATPGKAAQATMGHLSYLGIGDRFHRHRQEIFLALKWSTRFAAVRHYFQHGNIGEAARSRWRY